MLKVKPLFELVLFVLLMSAMVAWEDDVDWRTCDP